MVRRCGTWYSGARLDSAGYGETGVSSYLQGVAGLDSVWRDNVGCGTIGHGKEMSYLHGLVWLGGSGRGAVGRD